MGEEQRLRQTSRNPESGEEGFGPVIDDIGERGREP